MDERILKMQLKELIKFKKDDGIVIRGPNVQSKAIINPARHLKYYSVNKETEEIMAHNLKWVKNGEGDPRFQFVYIMLPTSCNQVCRGCFTGQDKSKLLANLDGPFFRNEELEAILGTAKQVGVQAVIYAGGGELFTWKSAFDYIDRIIGHGLGMVIFTNGTLLSNAEIAWVNDRNIALIISIRDTIEAKHNQLVGRPHFRLALKTIEECLRLGMQGDGRLAVEMPVTINNENRALNDLLPFCRALGIVPWIEEFIQISTSNEEQSVCHDFGRAREFFQKMAAKDAELGIVWSPEHGTRMIDQPQCRRPLYSFTVYPNGDVVDCPSHSRKYGNLKEEPLERILDSERVREVFRLFEYCPCSVFYTDGDEQIPLALPDYLEELR